MMGRLPGAKTGTAVLFESFVMVELAEYCGEVASLPIGGTGRSACLALIPSITTTGSVITPHVMKQTSKIFHRAQSTVSGS